MKEKDGRYYLLILYSLCVTTMELAPFGIFLLSSISLYFHFKQKVDERWNWPKALLASVPFILAILGLLNTSNFATAFSDLSRLLPFILFPFLFIIIPNEKLKQWQSHIIWAIIIGILIKSDFYLLRAVIRYFNTENIRHFYYINLAQETNSLSFFILVALMFSMSKINSNLSNINYTLGIIVLMLNLILVLLLLQSRVIIIVFILLSIILLFYNIKNISGLIISGLISITVLLLFNPSLNNRFRSLKPKESIKTQKPEPDIHNKNNCMGSSDLRLNAFRAAVEVIKANPIIGVGTGDWKDEIVSVYKNSGMECNYKEKTAPHNQYLRIAVKHGFLGLFFFIASIIISFYQSFIRNDLEAILFLACCSLCYFAYDFVDSGATAPFTAFLFSWFIIRRK